MSNKTFLPLYSLLKGYGRQLAIVAVSVFILLPFHGAMASSIYVQGLPQNTVWCGVGINCDAPNDFFPTSTSTVYYVTLNYRNTGGTGATVSLQDTSTFTGCSAASSATTTSFTGDVTLICNVPYTVFPGHQYHFVLLGNAGLTSMIGNVSDPYYVLSDSGGYVPPFVDTSTRIDTVQPEMGTTTASTSIPFSITGYIAPQDFIDGMTITMFASQPNAVYSTQVTQGVSLNGSQKYVFYPSSSGAFSFSTTSPSLPIGAYNMTSSIDSVSSSTPASLVTSFWNWLTASPQQCFNPLYPGGYFSCTSGVQSSALVSTSTVFLVSTSTSYDYSVGTYFIHASSSISAAINLATPPNCDSFSLNMGVALYCLLIPDQSQIAFVFNQALNGFLSVAPWGYVARVGVILVSTAPSSPPAFSFTFPALGYGSTTALASSTFSFNFWGVLSSSSSPLALMKSNPSPGFTSASVFDIVDPYISDLVYLFLIFTIISDLFGIDILPRGSSESIPDPDRYVLTKEEERKLENPKVFPTEREYSRKDNTGKWDKHGNPAYKKFR